MHWASLSIKILLNIRRPIILFFVSLVCGMITIYNGIKPLDKMIILSVVIFMLCKLCMKSKINSKTIIIIFIFFIIGALRFYSVKQLYDNIDKEALSYNNKQQIIYGKIENISESQNSKYLVLSNTKINGYNFLKTKCYYPKDLDIDFKIGNTVEASGKIYLHEKPMNIGEFNSQNYYRSINESVNIYSNNIKIIDYKINHIKQKIYNIKSLIKNQIYKIFNKKNAALFNAMLTGDKSGLDLVQKKLFQDSGIAHILAISGLHLSILGLALYELLRKRLSVRVSAFIVSVFILFYAIFIDASFTNMRAIIMLYIKFLSLSRGRTYDSKNTLFIVAFCFIFYSPYLIFNAGFQFSYVAVFALNYEYKFESNTLAKIRKNIYDRFHIEPKYDNKNIFNIPAMLVLTLFIFPITVFNYFDYPLYSIVINLLVVPLMTFVLTFGIFGVLLSFISVILGRFVVGIVHFIILFYELVCKFFDKLPFSTIHIGKPALIFIIIFYIVLFLTNYKLAPKYFYSKKKQMIIKKLPIYKNILVYPLLLLILIMLMGLHINRGLRFTSLYIGQGDSLIVELDKKIYTIDGGSSSNTSAGQYILAPHLKSRAINDIEISFITHADSDHTNCIEYLLNDVDDININNIALPINAKDNPKYDKLIKPAISRGVNILYIKAGDIINFDKMRLLVFNPIEDSSISKSDINEQSLCFKLIYDNKSILFTGDIGAKIEEQMLNIPNIKNQLNSDIYKVAHHGSKNSNTIEFLKYVNPKYSVISYGINNNYNHPHPDTIQRLESIDTEILKTGESGEIDIYIENKNIKIKKFIQ